MGKALKSAGGASSEYVEAVGFLSTLQTTFEHLREFTEVLFDEQKAENLRNHCEQLRVPIDWFLEDVTSKFEPSLGASR